MTTGSGAGRLQVSCGSPASGTTTTRKSMPSGQSACVAADGRAMPPSTCRPSCMVPRTLRQTTTEPRCEGFTATKPTEGCTASRATSLSACSPVNSAGRSAISNTPSASAASQTASEGVSVHKATEASRAFATTAAASAAWSPRPSPSVIARGTYRRPSSRKAPFRCPSRQTPTIRE